MKIDFSELMNDEESMREARRLQDRAAQLLRAADMYSAADLIFLLYMLYMTPEKALQRAGEIAGEEAGARLEGLSEIASEGAAEDSLQAAGKDITALAALMPHENAPGLLATPLSIIRLAERVLDIRPGDRAADFCCGAGTFLLDACMKSPEAQFTGYEIDGDLRAAALLRADILDIDADIRQEDVFEAEDRFDRVFANFPISERLTRGQTDRLRELGYRATKRNAGDWAFNEAAVRALLPGGRAVTVMSAGGMRNAEGRRAREYFAESGLLEAVILLPERMYPGTKIRTMMMVFSSGNEKVRFIDATDECRQGRRQAEFTEENISAIAEKLKADEGRMFLREPAPAPMPQGAFGFMATKKRTEEDAGSDIRNTDASRYEIEREGFDLMPDTYLDPAPVPGSSVPLKEVVTEIRRGANLKASELDRLTSDDGTDIRYLATASIEDGGIRGPLPSLTALDPKLERSCLETGDIVLSRNLSPYKSAVAEVPPGQKILANGNLYILRPDAAKIDPYFLQAYLCSDVGRALLARTLVGDALPTISRTKLKELPVPKRPPEEQKKIARRYKASMQKIRDLEGQLSEAREEMRSAFKG
ncbi:MAG: N-6 DNA methylase [Anaerovoracaceae bacterium]|nr:N-6 DNA methylase [Anaerovoracaceae bacterium]